MPSVLLVMRLHIFDYSLIPKREPKPFQPTSDLHCIGTPTKFPLSHIDHPPWTILIEDAIATTNLSKITSTLHENCAQLLKQFSVTVFILFPMADPFWLEFSAINLEMEVVSHALAKWITSHCVKDHLRIYTRIWCQKLHGFLFWASGVTGKMW